MKKITAVDIATVFTGSFLGAGFLSGQELLQFFGVFGGFGLAGMVLSICAFCLFSLLVLHIAKRTGRMEFDHIIIHKDIPWLRAFVSGVFLFLLFDVMVAMVAGAGSLLNQIFGLPVALGAALMSAVVLVVALTGAAGMVQAFNVVVPLLIIAAIAVSALAFTELPAAAIEARPFSPGNPLLGNWLCSALSFISYNMMGAISILVPLAQGIAEEKTIHKGLLLGGGLLTLVFVFILLPMIFYFDLMGSADLPMLALAYRVTGVGGMIYGVLLFCGMFTSALSALFAITSRAQLTAKGTLSLKRTIPLLCVLSFVCSLFGFKNMVAVVYPICGYIGLFALGGILVHSIVLKREANTPI